MIKNIIRVLLSNVATIISGIVIGFIIPKILSVRDYGMYKTFTLYMTYAGFFSLGIIDGIVLKFGAFFPQRTAGGETFLGSGQAEGGRLFYNYSAPADDFLSNRSDRYCRTGGNGTACPG